MTLARFFDSVAPVLLGETPLPATFYGAEKGREIDRKRLAIYVRFCRLHRFEIIDGIFPHCRAAAERLLGKPAWEALVDSYFRQYPMHEVELNANGASWPAYLVQKAKELPAWLPSLADFEWWEWQTIIAPDPAPATGLRLNPTVELRPYGWDFVDWIENDQKDEPDADDTVVIFWRDTTLTLCRENAEPIELLVLKSVVEGIELTPAILKQVGFTRRQITTAQQRLRKTGVIEGT